jgi:predicted nucleic acid-binding protein
MKDVLVDAGPLVAFLNRRDQRHRWAVETFGGITGPLRTCEAVLSEACFLVRKLEGGADSVLQLVVRGIIEVPFRLSDEVVAVRKLMTRYASVPMSLADASLVRMTELDSKLTVMTLDADFRIYRRLGRQVVPVLMPEDT